MQAKTAPPQISAAKRTKTPRPFSPTSCGNMSSLLDIKPKLYFIRDMTLWFFRSMSAAVISAALLSASSAFACCTVAEARQALRVGNFDLAASAAPQLGTTEARLIAAEALSAKVLLGMAEDDKDTARKALALSESVLLEDPNNKEARFQYALADGFITRATSPFSAWRKKLPQKTKVIVDDLIERSPEDGRAHALLGAWHLGILRKTGDKNGKKWFDADPSLGQAAYETALLLRPDDIIIRSNYALSLAELDFETHKTRAREMLVTALAAQPKDAVERDVQLRMREVLNLWGDDTARAERIEQFLDGKG